MFFHATWTVAWSRSNNQRPHQYHAIRCSEPENKRTTSRHPSPPKNTMYIDWLCKTACFSVQEKYFDHLEKETDWMVWSSRFFPRPPVLRFAKTNAFFSSFAGFFRSGIEAYKQRTRKKKLQTVKSFGVRSWSSHITKMFSRSTQARFGCLGLPIINVLGAISLRTVAFGTFVLLAEGDGQWHGNLLLAVHAPQSEYECDM